MRTLIVAEHDNTQLHSATLATVTAARAIGQPIDLLIVGHQCPSAAEAAATVDGVATVFVVDSPACQHQLAEDVAHVVVETGKNYSHIFAAATSMGKNVMPRVAALLDVEQISDIIEIENAHTFKRPFYAGNAIATVQSSAKITVGTIRSTAFDNATKTGGSATITPVSFDFPAPRSSFVKAQCDSSDRPSLSEANVVVSGGRGVGSAENFSLLYALADSLGGTVGASRAAVDAGFVANDLQVGQTGQVVAPTLYIAVGISGAIQHLAGMSESKVIVAINSDEEAPIFDVADYGLVGDLLTLLPEMVAMIEKDGTTADIP